MKQSIHPQSKLVTFKCANCGAEYKILSTSKQEVVSIDVCANCHPVFLGQANETVVKGRAEKLANKFATKNFKPKQKKKKTSSKKTISNFSEIKAN